MAYDKIITIRRRMDNCLGYVLNEEKNSLSHALSYAENPRKAHQLVTGINCQANTAFAEMQATKLRWDNRIQFGLLRGWEKVPQRLQKLFRRRARHFQ